MLPELAKLLIAPTFVACVTLVARRGGPAAAGFLAGLPVVGAPILGLLIAAHGNAFGATSALGTAIGTAPTMLFALVYALLAPRLKPFACLLASYTVYFVAAGAAVFIPVTWPFAIAVPVIAWVLTLRAFPNVAAPLKQLPAPRWDIPVRVTATLVVVTVVTSLAKLVGPQLAGLVTPIPIITAVLAVFSHSQGGPAFSAVLLRELVRGLVTFLSFFWLMAALLPLAPAVYAFTCGVMVCAMMHTTLGKLKAPVVPSAPASHYE
jgi:hypothetical protein